MMASLNLGWLWCNLAIVLMFCFHADPRVQAPSTILLYSNVLFSLQTVEARPPQTDHLYSAGVWSGVGVASRQGRQRRKYSAWNILAIHIGSRLQRVWLLGTSSYIEHISFLWSEYFWVISKFKKIRLQVLLQGSHCTWKTRKNESTRRKPGNIVEFWKI